MTSICSNALYFSGRIWSSSIFCPCCGCISVYLMCLLSGGNYQVKGFKTLAGHHCIQTIMNECIRQQTFLIKFSHKFGSYQCLVSGWDRNNCYFVFLSFCTKNHLLSIIVICFINDKVVIIPVSWPIWTPAPVSSW